MIQVKIINTKEDNLQDEINEWLQDKQINLEDGFKLIDIKINILEPSMINYYGAKAIATIIYDEIVSNCTKIVPPQRPKINYVDDAVNIKPEGDLRSELNKMYYQN